MSHAIHCGTFESESHWRDPALAKLPSIPNPSGAASVQAMDEMLFVFCGKSDQVITAHAMNSAHVQYLREIGFCFSHNTFDLNPGHDEEGPREGAPANIFALMTSRESRAQLRDFLGEGGILEPFAVLSGTAEAARAYELGGRFPSLDVIRRVNTKSYSLEIRRRLGIPGVGFEVSDISRLCEVGATLLQTGAFLIKDDYGVSGRGNQLVTSRGTLEVISKHLTRQVNKGLRLSFVLEPYWDKAGDFSCQFRVSEDGATTHIAVQRLDNNGLAFGTSRSASEDFLNSLDAAGYFELMGRIGTELHRDGYHGDVCVDSMELADGTFHPLVEINARKSMSLIKHHIDQHLARSGFHGCLTSVPLINERGRCFADVLEQLRSRSLLFQGERDFGVLPLTCGTAFGPRFESGNASKRGRLYFAAVCDSDDERHCLVAAFRKALEETGFRALL